MGFKLIPTVVPTMATLGRTISDTFTNPYENSYNKITHGGGMFTMSVGDVVHRVQPKLLVVFAGYSGESSQSVRQVLYLKNFASTGKEERNALPDCSSNDGKTPNDSVVNKQAVSCTTCQHNTTVTPNGLCKKRKEYLMYVLEEDEHGEMIINYDTPYVFDVPPRSLFVLPDATTGAGGFMRVINNQISKNRKMVSLESNVFELGFYDGTTSPLIKPTGHSIPDDVLQRVLVARSTAQAQRLVSKNEDGSPLIIEYKKKQELSYTTPTPAPAVRPTTVVSPDYSQAFAQTPAPVAPVVSSSNRVSEVLSEAQDKVAAAAAAFFD